MIIDELKEKGINTTQSVIKYLARNNRGTCFLPENLTELIAQIAKSNSPKNCINLNSNIGEILSKCKDIDNTLGLDVSQENIEIAKYLNPTLHFENSNPINYSIQNKFDVVICFPPLGQRIEVNGRKVPSSKLYITKSLELLSIRGKAILVLPHNFLTASVYKEIRSDILENYGINKVISLPQKLLINTGVKLSIIEVVKKPIERTEFYKIQSLNFNAFNKIAHIPDFKVSKENLNERWDYSYHNPKNREYENELKSQKTKKLAELVEVFVGTYFSNEEKASNGDYLWFTTRNLSNGKFQYSANDIFISKKEFSIREQTAIIQKGDILISRIHRTKETFYVHTNTKQKLIAWQHFIILRGKNAEYVAAYLNTDYGINLFNQQIKRQVGSSTVPTISVRDLKNIEIPILPIGDLELTSKRSLEKLSYEELLKINEKYNALKSKFNTLKKGNTISAHEAQLNSMQETLNEVLSNQKVITIKLDDIKSTLIELTNDFKLIKDLPRDIDEKIIRLNENLDSKLETLLQDQKQIDFYIKEIKRWFDFYDILEVKSQKYLPEAEYIFDHISKLQNPDYSPFILQYCRALENELLKKIFRAYVQSLIDQNIDIEEDFAWDFGRKESGKLNNDNTFRLAKHLKRCLGRSEEEWFFELGSMEVNLRYLTGRTVDKSPLLQDLKSFVLNRFKDEFLNIEYLDEIKTIIRDYRNQSAHPNLIDTQKAIKFHKQMKQCLVSLMENYKK
ncbi:N-6 DNA methylase [Tenacibaculum sp. 190130A14a]|uniref:Uncharacterized protein n=1 Tax=Tenacibaculum polynesiense TaxID=3137857 RepID=A0ABP1ETJ9_9FLAO